MAKNEIVEKIIIKVYLVNGKEIPHEYYPPTSEKAGRNFIREIVHRMGALSRGENKHLYFENPHITYNPDNVVGIELSAIGAEELRKALERAQRRIGLIPKQS